MKKKAWRYHHFTHAYQKLRSHDVWFLRYGAKWTEGQTDGRTEKVTHRGGDPPKKVVGFVSKYCNDLPFDIGSWQLKEILGSLYHMYQASRITLQL